MSSIKVALELDDSKYTQRLKEATTAADKFAKAATTGASQTEASFAKVSASADGLHSALNKVGSGAEAAARMAGSLVTALSGLAAVAFVQSLLNGASASKDMSEAFGLSVESVLELQAAFGAAGRGPEKLNQALSTLSDTAVSALQGNYALRDSFSKLGISMSDLQNKSAKEIIAQVADVMTSGKANASQLAASYDILGKSAKGLPWGDLKDKLDSVNGTMGPAAQAAIELDQTMKKLEATGGAVKKEFTLLLQPIAEFFNSISSNGNGAKLIAEGIAAAMALMVGSAIINGVKTLISVFSGLTSALGLTAVATAFESGAMVANTRAIFANATARAAGATARAASLASTIAEAQAVLAGTAATMSEAAAKRVLETTTWRLSAAQAAMAAETATAAAAQRVLTGAQAAGVVSASAVGTASVAATAGVTGLGTALYAIGFRVGAMVAALGAAVTSWAGFTALISGAGAALVAFLGPVGAVIAAIAAIGTAISLAFDLHPIDAMADKLESLVKDTFPSLHGWINKIGDALGMAPSKLTQATETSAERLKRLGVKPNESGGRAAIGPQAQAGDGVSVVTQGPRGNLAVETGVAAGVPEGNPMAAQEASLREQMKLLKLTNELQEEKLKKQLELVGASEAEKASKMAAFEFESKKKQDLLRIDGEIAKMEATMKSGVKGEDAGKYKGQLALLQQQRKYINEQKDDTSAMTGEIIRQTDAIKNAAYYRELDVKGLNNVKDITRAIADLSASEDQRKLNALEKQIELEIQAAQKRIQDQKGPSADPMGQEEAAAIAERVRNSFAGQVEAQKTLNDETRKRNAELFTQELTNNAITEAIRLQAEMAKLTQSSDQQKITDLNTQLELMIRQQIVKEQSTLGKGETLSEERQLAIREEVMKANKGLLSSNQELIDKGRAFNTGWGKAWEDYKSDAENAAAFSNQVAQTIQTGFEDAFVNFVRTGKLSFKDLANSIIADFARMTAKKALSGLFGSEGAGGGIFAAVKGLFGGNFAAGGEPPMGKISVVGENGPELFVPKTPGTIIPNGAIMGGGQQQTIQQITYNIQATDAASFKSQLARDPSFVHAVVEQGRRSTPAGARR